MEETNTQSPGLNVSGHIASLRRSAAVDTDGRTRRSAIATCIGMLPEQFDALMRDGSFTLSRSIPGKMWNAMSDAAEFKRTDCITSPFGVLGHDVVALHLIVRTKTHEEKAFMECQFYATANAPKLHTEKTAEGVVLRCLDVRMDYAGMMYPDLWPEAFKLPNGAKPRSPFRP